MRRGLSPRGGRSVADLGEAGGQLFHDLRMRGRDVRFLVGILRDVEEHVTHEFPVPAPDGGKADAPGDFEDDLVALAGLIREEHAGHVEGVDGTLLFVLAAREGDEGGVEIGDEHHAVLRGAGLGVSRPAHETGDAHAALEGRVLGAAPGFAHRFEDRPVVIREDEQGVVAEAVLVEGRDDPADRLVEALEHGITDGERIVLIGRIVEGRVERSVDGVEGNVEKERLLLLGCPGRDDALGLGGEEIGGIALFTQWFLVAVPVVDREAGRGIVDDGLGVIVDAPGVVAVLVQKPLTHGKVLGEPLSEVPLPDEGGEVTRLLESLRHGPLIGVEGVDTPGRFAAIVVGEGEPESLEVTRLAEVLGAPVRPRAEGVATSEKGAPGRGTHGVGVELGELEALGGELVEMGG